MFGRSIWGWMFFIFVGVDFLLTKFREGVYLYELKQGEKLCHTLQKMKL